MTNKKSGGRHVTPSIIGADCAVTGDILSQGELHIDGRVDGDIRCTVLVIGQSGTITGEISAEEVTVLGSVTGQITARIVALAKTARILGDITHESLSVEAGACVEGRFDRLPAESAGPAAERQAEAAALRSSGGPALIAATKYADDEASTEAGGESAKQKVILLGN